MARSNTLTDMQLVLLTSAAGRPDGSLLPPPASLGDQLARIRLSVRSLIKRELAVEIDVVDRARAWREDGDRHIGVAITSAGRAAIGDDVDAGGVLDANALVPTDSAVQRPATKQVLIIGLLSRDSGASLTELVTATGWLPHTTRAALTGLRKKGHAIGKDKVGEETRYRIATAA